MLTFQDGFRTSENLDWLLAASDGAPFVPISTSYGLSFWNAADQSGSEFVVGLALTEGVDLSVAVEWIEKNAQFVKEASR